MYQYMASELLDIAASAVTFSFMLAHQHLAEWYQARVSG